MVHFFFSSINLHCSSSLSLTHPDLPWIFLPILVLPVPLRPPFPFNHNFSLHFLLFHLPPPDLQQQQLRGRRQLSAGALAEADGRRHGPFHHCQLSRSVVRTLQRQLQRQLGCRRWEGDVRGKEQEEQQRQSRSGTEGRPQVSHLLRETPPLRRGHHGNLLHVCLSFHWAFPPR